MTPRTAVLMFSCLPEDLEWGAPNVTISGLQQELAVLQNAILVDLAERLSELSQYHVIAFETSDAQVGTSVLLPSKVERRIQTPGTLQRRINDAVKEVMDGGEYSSVVVFLGRNPLYPMSLLGRGVELLAEEDDVIVIGEGIEETHHPSLMWLAFKSFHPELFEQSERWWQGGTPLLQAAADVQALVMAVRGVRNIASMDDLGYLFHEIEREVLLKQWYPVRTYEELWRMRRKHLIPEIVE